MILLQTIPDASNYVGDYQSFTATLNTIINTIQSGVISDVNSFGRALGLFGAIYTLIIYYQKCQINGDPIVLKELYPLFIIVVALSAFPFITSAIDRTGLFIQMGITKSVNQEDLTKKVQAHLAEINKSNEQNNTTKDSTNSSFFSNVADAVSHPIDTATTGMTRAFNYLILGIATGSLMLIITLVNLIFNILFTIKKMMLYLFGPFSIGLSAIPIYRKSGLNWLNSYFALTIAQAIASIFILIFRSVAMTLISSLPSQVGVITIVLITFLLYAFAALIIGMIFNSEKFAGKLMALDTTSSASGVAGGVLKGAAQVAKTAITKTP